MYCTTTQHLVGGVISGYNTTVFAYGPSGTARGSVPWSGSVAVGFSNSTKHLLCAGVTPVPLHPYLKGR